MSATVVRSSKDLIQLEERHGAHNYHPLDVVIVRGEGVWVWDVEGKKYLDFLAAYSAVNQGHCHPRLLKALTEQASKVTLTSRAFRNDQLGLLCEEITKLTGYTRFLPMNSGAEAVETAIKLARKWGYTVKGIPQDKAEILVFDGNFHGRTTAIVGFSSDEQYKDGFGPYTGGFEILPYGDISAVENAITPNTAAVLLEPIQGESGIISPPEGFLKQLRELCSKNRVLLIVDEIQSGLGRTGKFLASDHEGVRPDLVIVGKALSGGFLPVSGVLADDEVMLVLKPGDHGSTFGGSPLASAVAREALKVLMEEGMIENSRVLGDYFLNKLKELNSSKIKEIRGKGLWIGLELKHELGGARRFCEALKEEGMLCKETHTHTIRFAPPLVISKEQIDWALERIAKVLA